MSGPAPGRWESSESTWGLSMSVPIPTGAPDQPTAGGLRRHTGRRVGAGWRGPRRRLPRIEVHPAGRGPGRRPGVTVHVRLDERSAGFTAVGLGLATGRPAVVLTTSGTAAAELHAAVVEADLARVPLLVCTADRPPGAAGRRGAPDHRPAPPLRAVAAVVQPTPGCPTWPPGTPGARWPPGRWPSRPRGRRDPDRSTSTCPSVSRCSATRSRRGRSAGPAGRPPWHGVVGGDPGPDGPGSSRRVDGGRLRPGSPGPARGRGRRVAAPTPSRALADASSAGRCWPTRARVSGDPAPG